MAVARTDPYGNIYCPSCQTKLTEDDQISLPGLFGITLLGDLATLLFAGVLVAIGMVWTPAYIVAAVVVCGGMIWHFRKRQRFVCGGCKRTYTRQELKEG